MPASANNYNEQTSRKKLLFAFWFGGVFIVFAVIRTWMVYGFSPIAFVPVGIGLGMIFLFVLIVHCLDFLGKVTGRHYDLAGMNVETGKNQIQELISSPKETIKWNAQSNKLLGRAVFSDEYLAEYPVLVKKMRLYYWLFTVDVGISFLIVVLMILKIIH